MTGQLVSLPGDDDDLRLALGVLASSGMLPSNKLSDGWQFQVSPVRQQVYASRLIQRTASCPRCSRPTAVTAEFPDPSVCTACRADWISHHPDWANDA